jgi:pyrroloquinoline quinone (PQQ) biosynthesis protein C
MGLRQAQKPGSNKFNLKHFELLLHMRQSLGIAEHRVSSARPFAATKALGWG